MGRVDSGEPSVREELGRLGVRRKKKAQGSDTAGSEWKRMPWLFFLQVGHDTRGLPVQARPDSGLGNPHPGYG